MRGHYSKKQHASAVSDICYLRLLPFANVAAVAVCCCSWKPGMGGVSVHIWRLAGKGSLSGCLAAALSSSGSAAIAASLSLILVVKSRCHSLCTDKKPYCQQGTTALCARVEIKPGSPVLCHFSSAVLLRPCSSFSLLLFWQIQIANVLGGQCQQKLLCSGIVCSRIFCFLSAFAWGRRWLRCSFCKSSLLQRDQLGGSCDGDVTQAEYCLRSQGTMRESCKHVVAMPAVSASLFSHMHACNCALVPDVECATVERPNT